MTPSLFPTALQPRPDSRDRHDRLFDFEADFVRSLRCIPMAVRFKLDRVGVKMSLRQWSRIGIANRRLLLTMRCDKPIEAADYAQLLTDMIRSNCDEPVAPLQSDAPMVWLQTDRTPACVIAQAARDGLAPPDDAAWAGLATLERFALVKLARSNHDNDNFAPAMHEFGLAP